MTQTFPRPLWEKKIRIQHFVELAVHRRVGRSPCILPLFDFDIAAPMRVYSLHTKIDVTPTHINLLFPLAAQHSKFYPDSSFVDRIRDFVAGLIDLENASFFHGDVRSDNTCIYRGHSVFIDLGNTWPLGKYRYVKREEPRHTYLANLAPEMISGNQEYGKEIDIWGLGVTLLELYHKQPFSGHTLYASLHKEQLSLAGKGSPIFDGLPPEVSEFIATLLTINPASRPTLQQLASQLGVKRIHHSLPRLTAETVTDYLSVFNYSEELLSSVAQDLIDMQYGDTVYTADQLSELTQLLFETNGSLYPR